MDIIDQILTHPKFINYIRLNKEAETLRKFCHHDLKHAVDVARVAYIISLENKFSLSKEIIYSAALLHDIAKWKQYRDNIDHAEEGAVFAEEILMDLGVSLPDTGLIVDAIRNHRHAEGHNSDLSTVLYKADKACRLCVNCSMIGECKRFKDNKKPVLHY